MEMTVTVSQLILDAVRAKLPRSFFLVIDGSTDWSDEKWTLRYVLKGKLASGMYYDVVLDLSDDRASWLNDGELLREVDKAARAFRVAIALDGEQPLSRNSNHHPALFGTSKAFGAAGPFMHVMRNSFDTILPEE
jgi:hypothetical protein